VLRLLKHLFSAGLFYVKRLGRLHILLPVAQKLLECTVPKRMLARLVLMRAVIHKATAFDEVLLAIGKNSSS
jgi:hypothetical protein